MATIKAIDGQSVHRIQSGQVIVDLCSVAKELVENSLDAGATSIEIRFKDNGLDSLEVQDNGEGISPENYETVALRHATSKLSTYEDLETLRTFGFRGEALASLCAVSDLHITTSRETDAPKGKRLEFDRVGKLRSAEVVAAQKGTTVIVSNLFGNLPVRRRELERNVKREYGKLLGMLQAYACISTGVRFMVSNQMSKGRKATVFATHSNSTMKENIMNVFGSKILASLISLNLRSELHSAKESNHTLSSNDDGEAKHVQILGHISRPTFGEGRQAPDRQMFFVNKRPCGLPQVAKAFNEAYKMYNVSQSPFIVADLKIDTNAYDVNVSPDKRTILLHDQTALLEAIKSSLIELFETQDQTVPQSQMSAQKLPAFRQLSISRVSKEVSNTSNFSALAGIEEPAFPANVALENSLQPVEVVSSLDEVNEMRETGSLLENFGNSKSTNCNPNQGRPSCLKNSMSHRVGKELSTKNRSHDELPDCTQERSSHLAQTDNETFQDVASLRESNETNISSGDLLTERIENDTPPLLSSPQNLIAEASIVSSKQSIGVLRGAVHNMRPRRSPADTATITIGSQTIISPMKSPAAKRPRVKGPHSDRKTDASQTFADSLRAFVASDSQTDRVREGGVDTWSSMTDSDEPPALANNRSSVAESEHASNGSFEDERDEHVVIEGHARRPLDKSLPESSEELSNEEYSDFATQEAEELSDVRQPIHQSEKHVTQVKEDIAYRLRVFQTGGVDADSPHQVVQLLRTSTTRIEEQCARLNTLLRHWAQSGTKLENNSTERKDLSAEERLSLNVSKGDFSRMKVVGQFNLGFILATRYPYTNRTDESAPPRVDDELFIIDQHASDEIYNFERLQAQTVVQNQRLVVPRTLELTAIEEEIIMENAEALEKNGFSVEVDDSGDEPVGRRCRLVSLPMSREAVFDTRDLEELLALLADAPSSSSSASLVVRPSKVRRMFAMRACRSSIMVGRGLNMKQMIGVVRHMGEIDKPWNCPHGRPTMRHLMTLNAWDGWAEGYGLADQTYEDDDHDRRSASDIWTSYLQAKKDCDGTLDERASSHEASAVGEKDDLIM